MRSVEIFDFVETQDSFLASTKESWKEFVAQVAVGTSAHGRVMNCASYGIYLDVGKLFPVLIECPNLARKRFPVDQSALPVVGTDIDCQIIQLVAGRRLARAVEL